MKDITGFGTTDEEFEALPVAVRRKVGPSAHFQLVPQNKPPRSAIFR